MPGSGDLVVCDPGISEKKETINFVLVVEYTNYGQFFSGLTAVMGGVLLLTVMQKTWELSHLSGEI